MCIVNKPVENAIGQRRVADLLVPARDWQLGCQDRRAHLIAILGDLPEIPALGFGQRSYRPVVDYPLQPWTKTGILASGGQTFRITASGSVNVASWNGPYVTDPDGTISEPGTGSSAYAWMTALAGPA